MGWWSRLGGGGESDQKCETKKGEEHKTGNNKEINVPRCYRG